MTESKPVVEKSWSEVHLPASMMTLEFDSGMIAILSGTPHNLGKAGNIEILAGASRGSSGWLDPLKGDRVQEETLGYV